jgi:hypothetical protein
MCIQETLKASAQDGRAAHSIGDQIQEKYAEKGIKVMV